ncbi:MAG: hypothetical protein AAF789_13570 [Bacteroidota bacterium]
MTTSLITCWDIPKKLGTFNYFDIGKGKDYFQQPGSTRLLLKRFGSMLSELEGNRSFKASLLMTGSFIQALESNQSLRDRTAVLLQKKKLELLAGTYVNSISSLVSSQLFKKEIQKHSDLLKSVFDYRATGFINTATIFSDDLLNHLDSFNFGYVTVPRVSWMKESWKQHPVLRSALDSLNLLLLGETTSKVTNVQVFDEFPKKNFSKKLDYILPYELEQQNIPQEVYRVPNVIMHGKNGSQMPDYLGTQKQKQYFKELQKLTELAVKSGNQALEWQLFDLMHLSNFESMQEDKEDRYSAYLNLMNCLADLKIQLEKSGS